MGCVSRPSQREPRRYTPEDVERLRRELNELALVIAAQWRPAAQALRAALDEMAERLRPVAIEWQRAVAKAAAAADRRDDG